MNTQPSNLVTSFLALLAPALAASVSPAQNAPMQSMASPPARVVLPLDQTELSVPLDKHVLTVRVVTHSQRADSFVLLNGQGEPLPADQVPAPTTYFGSVDGFPGSIVAASLHEEGWRLILDLGEAATIDSGLHGLTRFIYVQPWAELYPDEARAQPIGTHAVFVPSQIAPLDVTCGGSPQPPRPAFIDRYAPRSSCISVAQIAFDADHELYLLNGSSIPATVADVESVLNAVDLIYARDVLIDHVITSILVRDSPSDPYSAIDALEVLIEFATYWVNNNAAIQRDVAHLMTGRDVSGNVIGVAYLNTICDYGYGYSQTRFTTDLASRAALTAHELGHNWGAGHCDSDSDCFIMCSAHGGCGHNLTKFGARSQRDITTFRNTRICLSPGGPYPTARPDSVATFVNASILIDVLSNDIDGNCDALAIGSFGTTTPRGATISRSIGTGPTGRDQLLYTPRAGYVGEDTFAYVCVDSSNRASSVIVTVSVLSARPAATPLVTLPGLNASYHALTPPFVPDFASLVPYSSGTVANINFPAIDGAFATSGRSFNVAARFTGTLTIPSNGTYTFFTESDDGSTLYINNRLVVANDGNHGMFEVGGAIVLSAGTAAIRVEYFQNAGGSGLIARVQGPSLAKRLIPATWWVGSNVNVQYFAYPGAPSDMPNLEQTPRLFGGVVSTLNQANVKNYFASIARRDNIAARFTGFVTVPTTGIYTFFTTSDDGSTLDITQPGTPVRVVSNGGPHGMVERSGSVALAAGPHGIAIDFWQGSGGAGLVVQVQGPGLTKQPIPASMFSYLPLNASDCNSNGLLDENETRISLDVGDMLVGGNGLGNTRDGEGISPLNGVRFSSTAFAGSRTAGAPTFNRLDGLGGRALSPFIDGVFIPSGTTTISRSGATFLFSPTTGAYYNAIRNARGDTQPIRTADNLSILRRGVGLRANSGFTINLEAIKLANGGRAVQSFSGVAAMNFAGCENADSQIEFHVLIDGAPAYRRLISSAGNLAEPFIIQIPSQARTLTIASLEANNYFCDQLVVADASLMIAGANDLDEDRLPDICRCVADFNRDGGVDGADVEAFFLSWSAAEPFADVNLDGGIDGEDVEVFFARWQQGGC